MFDDCANDGVPNVKVDYAFVGKAHLFWISFDLFGAFRWYFHPKLNFSLFAVLLEDYTMVILRVSLNSDRG
jgi:hypothetical protein